MVDGSNGSVVSHTAGSSPWTRPGVALTVLARRWARLVERWRCIAAVAAAVLLVASGIMAGSAGAATPPANDDIGGATGIGSLPFSATQDSLTATSASTDPTPSCGAPNGSSVWYSFTPSADETITASTSGGDGFPPIVTAYTGSAGATDASVLTEAACSTSNLQFNVTGGTTYYFLLGSFTPRPSFTFTVAAVVPPANDDIGGATGIGSLPFSATQDSLTATSASTDPTPSCGAPNGSSVWYSFTPSTDGLIQISTSAADGFPPVPTAYSGQAGAMAASVLTEVGCSTSLPLQVSATVGTTYYFMVGSNLPADTFTLQVTPAVPFAAPQIAAPGVVADTDPGLCTANVNFGGLSVTGNPTPTIEVSPWAISGGSFPVGATSVTVDAFNAIGFASTNFTVTVTDHEKPQIMTPGDISADATQANGAVVDYSTPTAIDNCPGVSVTTSPASGSRFKIGHTSVTVTATDASGNVSTSTFRVKVEGARTQLQQLASSVKGVGAGQTLEATVRIAEALRNHGRIEAVCQDLQTFELQVATQTPSLIDAGTAATLDAQAQQIRSVLRCRP